MPKPRRRLESRGKISDSDYINIMEKVAAENYADWGFPDVDSALLHALNDNTYDYRGYYSKYPNGKGNAFDHWTDEFKTVYHPTFSDESKYSDKRSQYNPKGIRGGHWYGDMFIPSVPLLAERSKYKKGGNKDAPNIFKYTSGNGNVRYAYRETPDAEEIAVRPLNTIFPDPAQWTFTDDNGRFYTPRRTTPIATAELNPDNRSEFERAVDNYIGEATNTIPKGYHTLPAIGAIAGGLAYPALAEAALTSAFGAHGLTKWINGEINGSADAAMTALEIAPLGRLARPLYEGVVKPGMRLFNSPLTGNWTKIGNREYRLNPNSLGVNGAPLESRNITTELNISPEELYKALQEQEGYYFMGHGTGRTNVDPEVIFNNGLRIKNGDITNTTSPLSESNLVTWPHANSKEVIILPARAENTMFDSAYGRIPSDWYDANTFQWIDDPGFEGSGLFAVQKPNASFVETVVNGVPGVYTKPGAILGSYNTDTHVLRLNPNSQYKFQFSANTAPEITAENVANITPEQWTAAQDAAIARGDMAEAQRLRDLHFKVSAPNSTIVDNIGIPRHVYHGTPSKPFTIFDINAPRKHDLGTYGKGFYFTPNKTTANSYGNNKTLFDVYLNLKKPYTGSEDVVNNVGNFKNLKELKTYYKQQGIPEKELNVINWGNFDVADGVNAGDEIMVLRPNQIKSADAVTYDNNGVRIPLGMRDNFKINDIRYAFAPTIGGSIGYTVGKKHLDEQKPQKRDGGSIHIAPSKRGTFTAAATKHGMGVQEFASKVLKNKEDYSPSLVKKANFARNASKWNH